jgi:hypothetical protein
MRFGDTVSDPDPRIDSLGFSIEKECKLLGFTVSDGENRYIKNFELMKKKVTGIINIWKIFNLSLTGKITIVKTLIYPVLNYYLSILTPDPVWLNEIDAIIENFVTGTMNIGKEKLYLDPGAGGLGLIRSECFFKALKISWVRRCNILTHDNWRRKVMAVPDPGIAYIQHRDLSSFGPLITGILDAFIYFRNAFGTYANNFTLIPILNNNFFWINNGRLQRHLDTDFFNSSLPGTTDALRRTLCWRDISVDGMLQSINQLSNTLDTNITPQVYRILDNAFKIARSSCFP